MAQSQSARPTTKPSGPAAPQPALTLHQFDTAQALLNGELNVTVSELLGCDYIFIQHPAKTLLTHERRLANTLNQIIHILELAPRQKIFVGVHEDAQRELLFHRFTCDWQGASATNVSRTLITDDEQYEFMKMIFDCSSPCLQPPR